MDDLKTRRVGDVGLMDTLPDDVNVLVEKDGAVRRVPSDALGGAFYVTVTQTEDGNITADKSFDEIVKAYESGKALYCKINEGSEVLSCVAVHPDSQICTFASLNQPMCATVNYNSGEWRINYVQMARKSDLPEGFNGSWNDLKDKPFYDSEELTKVGSCWPVCAETCVELDRSFNLKVGKTYQIQLDEKVVWQGECKVYDSTRPYIGDQKVLEDSGYDGYAISQGEYAYLYMGREQVDGNKYYLEVYLVEFEPVPIDEKYIPNTIVRTGEYSWNDLNDKPFGEMEKLTLLASAEIYFSSEYGVDLPNSFNNALVEGKTYKIYVDGTEVLSDKCKNDDGWLYIGTHLFIADGNWPTGVTWGIADNGSVYFGCTGSFVDYEGHTVELYEVATETVPIDLKYLPKATAVANAAGDTPTAAEFNALLTALRNAGYLAT